LSICCASGEFTIDVNRLRRMRQAEKIAGRFARVNRTKSGPMLRSIGYDIHKPSDEKKPHAFLHGVFLL